MTYSTQIFRFLQISWLLSQQSHDIFKLLLTLISRKRMQGQVGQWRLEEVKVLKLLIIPECILVADSCWCMAKPIQYCKVINLQLKLKKFTLKKKKKSRLNTLLSKVAWRGSSSVLCRNWQRYFLPPKFT